MNLFPFLKKNNENKEVIIVSGLPRSGTSMMMKMLEAGGLFILSDHQRTADVDNPKGYYEYERVKKLKDGDVDWISEAEGKVVKVISFLLKDLPNSHSYKVVFMQRALPEILASQKKMLEHRNEDPNKLADEEMAQIFKKHLHDIYDWLNKQENFQSLIVDYNQLMEDPMDLIPEINSFLGGELNEEEMGKIIDSSLYRQRK